jgi:hypothetical protein
MTSSFQNAILFLSQRQEGGTRMTLEENKALTQRLFIEGWNKENRAATDEIFVPHFTLNRFEGRKDE